MKKLITFLFFLSGLFIMSANAQTLKAADKLYAQGVTSMKTLTVSSQKKAISLFEKAKIAYDTKTKKDLCDEQIRTCNSIIRKLTTNKTKPKEIEPEQKNLEDSVTAVEIVEIPKEPEVSLSTDPSSIVVPAKGGKYVEILVECNYEDWQIVSCPDWISYTTASNIILIKPEKNKNKSERAGVITIICKDKKAELIVKQSKRGFFG